MIVARTTASNPIQELWADKNKDNFKKYNINAILDADLTDKLKSTTNIIYKSSVQSRPNARYANAIQVRMYDPTGWFEYEPGYNITF